MNAWFKVLAGCPLTTAIGQGVGRPIFVSPHFGSDCLLEVIAAFRVTRGFTLLPFVMAMMHCITYQWKLV